MMTLNKEMAIQKITEMSAERVSKVLIFMAGMEAEKVIDKQSEVKNQRNPTNRCPNSRKLLDKTLA